MRCMSAVSYTHLNGAILGPIAKVLGWVMNGIYALMSMIGIENVGLSIIIFTIVIYAILFPLTYKQQKFSKLSQKMQPELQAIQKKYNGKKDQEMCIRDSFNYKLWRDLSWLVRCNNILKFFHGNFHCDICFFKIGICQKFV